MKLPSVTYPKYSITIPSTGDKTTFRPYNVGEEKVLLTALESGDTEQINLAVIETIKSCLDYDTSLLKTFDVEYIFTKLRSVSVSNTIDLAYRVRNCPLRQDKEDKSCEKDVKITVSLDQSSVQVLKNGEWKSIEKDDLTEKIVLSDTSGIVLSYPSNDEIVFSNPNSVNEAIIDYCVSAIHSVWDEDTVYTRSDFTKDEAKEFFLTLLPNVREKIVNFVSNIPVLRYETEYKCTKCDFKTNIELKGIDDFFG